MLSAMHLLSPPRPLPYTMHKYLFLLMVSFFSVVALAIIPDLARAQAVHPLEGRIWDVRAGAFVEPQALTQALAAVPFVLLGELHDNESHHRLRRDLLAALVAAGRRPAIAMEQFDHEQQPGINLARGERSDDAEHLRVTARYNDKSWPWRYYGPFVELALTNGLPLVAANLSRAAAFEVAMKGVAVLGEERARRLGLDEPLPAPLAGKLARVIDDGHCGKLPPERVPGMVDAQRARDAVMAALIAPHAVRGAVLIAGNGHVRRDFGVPLYLSRLAPDQAALSVGFVEALPGYVSAAEYPSAQQREFDYLWFTARVERGDPCAGLVFKPRG